MRAWLYLLFKANNQKIELLATFSATQTKEGFNIPNAPYDNCRIVNKNGKDTWEIYNGKIWKMIKGQKVCTLI